jgi:hypothetical protein
MTRQIASWSSPPGRSAYAPVAARPRAGLVAFGPMREAIQAPTTAKRMLSTQAITGVRVIVSTNPAPSSTPDQRGTRVDRQTDTPLSAFEAVLGVIFVVAGAVTEISAGVWLLSACRGAFPRIRCLPLGLRSRQSHCSASQLALLWPSAAPSLVILAILVFGVSGLRLGSSCWRPPQWPPALEPRQRWPQPA